MSFADEVGRALEVDLIVGEPAGLYADLDDPEAIEQVYLGWYHLTAGTPEGWPASLEHFGQVARSHPDQPYGHVLSAFANWMGVSNGWARDPEATLRKAREQAQVGLASGDPTGMARTVEAAILMSQGRGQEALEAIEKVEILRPTCDVTYGLEGSVRRYLGQWEKAVDLTDMAMRLTGVNKPWYPTVKACSLFMGGRVEQAAAVAEMVLEHQPQQPRGAPRADGRPGGAGAGPASPGDGRADPRSLSHRRRRGVAGREPLPGPGDGRPLEGRPRRRRSDPLRGRGPAHLTGSGCLHP